MVHSGELLNTACTPNKVMAYADDVLVAPLAWERLPDLDGAADLATQEAVKVVGPELIEFLDGYPECPDQEPHGLAPTAKHERETAALLHLALSDTTPLLRQTLTAAGRVHDAGKRVPGVSEDFHCGKLWTPEHRDFRAAQHELEGEERLMVLSRKQGADGRLPLIARLVGRHHCRDLLTIASPELRWMVGLLQEADKAQAILLDERKYKGDRLREEGLSIDEMARLERVIVTDFHTPDYFGIQPGRIFNIALKYHQDRRAQAATR